MLQNQEKRFKIHTMNRLKQNWFKVLMVILLLVIIAVWLDKTDSGTKNRWQAIYYPNGCLGCEDDWIFSPFFEAVNECVNWVHTKSAERGNVTDAAECAFDCKQKCNSAGCFLSCKETIDVLGKASF